MDDLTFIQLKGKEDLELEIKRSKRDNLIDSMEIDDSPTLHEQLSRLKSKDLAAMLIELIDSNPGFAKSIQQELLRAPHLYST